MFSSTTIKIEKKGEKMKKCEDCGKKLGIFAGYRHPTMGNNHLLCGNCYDKVSASVEEWKRFVLSNSFTNNSSKKDSQWNLHEVPVSFIKKRKLVNRFLVKKEA